ncbi:MAG TPA: 4-hydroxy-tetrahydrodipicolinate synthase [Longimicrobiales bacterium]
MANPLFDGSGVALVTPFRGDDIAEDVLRALVRFHIGHGTDALIVCGSTGEAATMSVEEQRRAVEIAIDENDGRLPVIVGCGGSSTREVVRLAENAAQAGADALLVSGPPYNKPTQKGLMLHVRAVLDAADRPVVLYNVPGRSAVNMLPATVAALADDDRVIAIKEASGDLSQVAEVARLTAGRLALYSGNDDQVLPVMSLGGRGVISVLANIAPAAVSRMAKAYLDGATAEATQLQLRYLPLIQAIFVESNPIPVKAAVAMLGFQVGGMRLPLTEATAGTRERLAAAMRDVGIRVQS